MTDWRHELITELQHRLEEYREREEAADEEDAEYWNGVANGLSEALEVAEEVDDKAAAEEVENGE